MKNIRRAACLLILSAFAINRSSAQLTTFDQVRASSNGTGQNFQVGDDVWLGDINEANTMSLNGGGYNNQGWIRFGSYGSGNGTKIGSDASGNFSIVNTGSFLYNNFNVLTSLSGVKTLGNAAYSGNLNTNQSFGGSGMAGMYIFNANTAAQYTPLHNWAHIIEMQHDNNNNWSGQIALDYFSGGMFWRQQVDADWSHFNSSNNGWQEVASKSWVLSQLSGTGGASGGYLPLSGGNITGNLSGFGDDTYLAWDAYGAARMGFTKKAGAGPVLAYGAGTRFAVSQSSAGDISASNTFTERLVIDQNGNVGIGAQSTQTDPSCHFKLTP